MQAGLTSLARLLIETIDVGYGYARECLGSSDEQRRSTGEPTRDAAKHPGRRARLKTSRPRVDPDRVAEQAPIERAFFREAEDGTIVFFPWGLAHRGYRVPDEAARKRASRAASLLISSTLGIGTWIAYAIQPLLEGGASTPIAVVRVVAAPGAALLLVVLSYGSWASRFVERLTESDLVVSREARLREAAELAKPREVALVGVAVCGLSALLVWLQAPARWLGLLGVALGLGVLFWSFVLKRAAEGGPADSSPRAS